LQTRRRRALSRRKRPQPPRSGIAHWVEYCNSPKAAPLSPELRAQSGSAQPFNANLGVGNESGAAVEISTAQKYAVEFRRYTAWLPGYGRPLLS